MQAEKITKIHANSEIQVQSGTIQCIDEQSYQILGQVGTYSATRAFSCLVEPIPGDKVLFSIGPAQQCHILSIIERLDSTQTSLAFPGEVTINARHGQLSLNGQQGLNISSKQKITLASEEYSLIAKKALFAIDSLTAVGSTVVAKIRNVQTIADTVETIADHLLQKLKNSFRLVIKKNHAM